MDPSSFDRIARALGGALSRRATLRAAIGAVAGLAVAGAIEATEAAPKKGMRDNRPGAAAGKRRKPATEGPCGDGRRKDNICTKDSDCCTGICNTKAGKKNKDRKGRCRCIRRGGPCSVDKNCCRGTCDAGICGGPACGAAGDACGTDGDCCTDLLCNAGVCGVCSEVGGSCAEDADCCAGLNCANGTCALPVPTSEACTEFNTCLASAATCGKYAERYRNGQYTNDTFCLLPNGESCTGDIDCESAFCDNGTCAAVVCDVCTSGCAYDSLDQALKDAPDDAIIRVDAGTWNVTNGDSASIGGGHIRDGRTLTVRACNGAEVNVTGPNWGIFYIEYGDQGGGWILEGLNIYPNSTSAGPSIYVYGMPSTPAVLTMRNCTVDNRESAPNYVGFMEVYQYTTTTVSDTTFSKGAGSVGAKAYGIYINGRYTPQPITLDLTRVTFDDCGRTGTNSDGAIFTYHTNATLTDCTLSTGVGSATTAGGGIKISDDAGPVNLTLAGTTTINGNTGVGGITAGGIFVESYSSASTAVTITIAPTASVTANAGEAGGGIVYAYTTSGANGTLTVTGGDRVTGNTATSGFQCARVAYNGSPVDVPGCTSF